MATADAVSPVPFFAFPFLWLQIMLFFQQSIVGFDEFMKVQAGRARHADVFVVIRIVFNLKSFGLVSFHFTCYSSRRKHAQWARWHPEVLA